MVKDAAVISSCQHSTLSEEHAVEIQVDLANKDQPQLALIITVSEVPHLHVLVTSTERYFSQFSKSKHKEAIMVNAQLSTIAAEGTQKSSIYCQ